MSKQKEMSKVELREKFEEIVHNNSHLTNSGWSDTYEDCIEICEAYHLSRINEVTDEDKEIMKFLSMILNSYKVINNNADYRVVHHNIVKQANDLKDSLLKSK